MEYEIGIGQSVYDNAQKPTKRYFLEKRWSDGENILGAILMNPSKATSVKGDNTINALIDYAKKYNYDALYVVNIIPLIKSKSDELDDLLDEELESMVREYKQKKFIKLLLTNSKRILLGWGEKGRKYFSVLIQDSKIKNDFIFFSEKCHTFDLNVNSDFPCHPFPNGIIPKNYLSRPLIPIKEELCYWLKVESKERI